MPYNSKITEQKPALVIIMVDQSGSMNEKYGGENNTPQTWNNKAQIVAQATNQMIMDLLARCRQGTTHKRYFDIAAIGYSGKGVYPILHDTRYTLSPAELIATVKRDQKTMRKVKHPNGSTITQYSTLKVWIEPYAEGQTPMQTALQKCAEILETWKRKQQHNDAFPPIIINITDGEQTDAQPQIIIDTINKIKTLGTQDGEPLIFNFHISSDPKNAVIFPTPDEEIPQDAKLLHQISSDLPPMYNEQIAAIKNDVDAQQKTYRAFSYNLPTMDFIKALCIGTATTSQISR